MSFDKMTIRDLPLAGKTVLVRADYNVPLSEEGGKQTIHDDYRIVMSLPTVQYLREQGCKVVLCAHLGRPDGKPDARYSLEPVAQRLADYLHTPVRFVPACVGDRVRQAVKGMSPGEVILLENLRFHAEEEANDAAFARQLAGSSLADYFVQDGFGVVHRAHASTEAVTHHLPSVAGLLLERECSVLGRVAHRPRRPFSVVLGGAKISDKVQVVEQFIKKADKVIIGGAMANNFLAWQGYQIGKSKFDEEAVRIVERIMHKLCGEVHDHRMCVQQNEKLLLPLDVAVGAEVSADAQRVNKPLTDVAADDYILDVGEATIAAMEKFLEGSATVLWNGTLGYAEVPAFAAGSAALAAWLAGHKDSLESVVGGGDTADFVLRWDAAHGDSFSHVSTGGGASLELLSGKTLPGVAALLGKK
ncbi:phosphoglycerate kinase [Candidatus Saccharibacteria bacterium]|nr:phosphoglycerate kinase [Candidatus Saccharibacteria bacterium]